MPSRGRKFITEFLVPNLNKKKFGSRLEWLNIEEAVFQLKWNHKSASDWEETDAEVFIEWDKRKGHYRPEEKDYYTKSKQRFRAVLYKLIREQQITELCTRDKSTKIYCIGKKEQWELENIMSFKFPSSLSYSVENPVESAIEDHKYSQDEQCVSENDDDMLSLYPITFFPFPSDSENTCSKRETVQTVDDKSFQNHLLAPNVQPVHNHLFVHSDQPALHVDIIIAKDSLENESLNLEDLKLIQNFHENSFTSPADALCYETRETYNYPEGCSNYVQSYL